MYVSPTFIVDMDNFEQQNTNDTSVTDFSSLHSPPQHDCERNNISNIITQLLRLYQPENDITAYEHVLRKVQDLLEDCDLKKQQLLLSMIPAPNNMPDHTIKEVFRTITGFIKLNLQKNDAIQNTFDIKNMDETTDNNASSSKQSFLYDKNAPNFKSSLFEDFPFRGFSESEISTIHNHAKNVNHLYRECDFSHSDILADISLNSESYIDRQADSSTRQSNNNSRDWLDGNNKYQMSSYRHLFNKKHCVPAKTSTTSELQFCYSPQAIYQDTSSMKTYNDTEIADLWQDKIPRQFNDVRYEYKKYEDAFDKDKKSGISHTIIDIGQNATIKQTIKDDIHKMDVCWDEDRNIVVDADDLLATASDRLKTSLNNFLKRAQEGTSVELSAFPCTRPYPQVGSLNMAHLTSKDRKPGMPHDVLGQDFASNVSSNDGNSCLFLQQQNTNVSLGKSRRKSDERTEQNAFASVSGLQTECSSQELDEATEQQNNSDYIMEDKAAIFECKKNNTKKSIYGCKMVRSPSNVNPENKFQAHSMSQLAAYKKQCYDTLLSVQRAKAAVTNSLASSSERLTSYDDPCYTNYTCQQQHLLQQQRHFTARPQFSTYPADLSGLSSVHSNQYSWERSVCKYLLLKQLRLQRQTPPLYARSQGWIHPYLGPVYPYSFMPNGKDQTKYYVRRKSLEDIVGKLKDQTQ